MAETPSVNSRSEVDRYDFQLPKELIAQQPLPNRSDARLLVVDRKQNSIEHSHIRDIADYLRDGDAVVVNETKVIPAKLVGYKKATGGRWQGLFLESDGSGNMKLLCKTRGRLKPEDIVVLQDRNGADRAELIMVGKLDGGAWIVRPNRSSETDEPFDQESFLADIGRVPLPHYIRGGSMTDDDLQRYQTVYAKNAGSVAAPTAGLHFNRNVISGLIDKGVAICRVTLHVGLGTFRPITTTSLDEHQMHAESGWVEKSTAEKLDEIRKNGGRVIAVGTTSVRLLESSYSDGYREWSGDTNLFIRPPYHFRAIDGMLTNFHLPRTTLLVLVRTFGGDALISRAYAEAVAESYRFFSYGDAMLIV